MVGMHGAEPAVVLPQGQFPTCERSLVIWGRRSHLRVLLLFEHPPKSPSMQHGESKPLTAKHPGQEGWAWWHLILHLIVFSIQEGRARGSTGSPTPPTPVSR